MIDLKTVSKNAFMRKLAILAALALALAGCGDAQKPAPSPSASESADAFQSATCSFSKLVTDEDGTTTDVQKDAYTLRYNADWFTRMPEEGNDYLSSFVVHGPVGVDHITVRIAPEIKDGKLPADCFDYFKLEQLDDASEDQMKTLQTRQGTVTYYVSVSGMDEGGYRTRAYYALPVDGAAFCGVMDVADEAAAGVVADETAARAYLEEVFESGTAKKLFENLFVEITRGEEV